MFQRQKEGKKNKWKENSGTMRVDRGEGLMIENRRRGAEEEQEERERGGEGRGGEGAWSRH